MMMIDLFIKNIDPDAPIRVNTDIPMAIGKLIMKKNGKKSAAITNLEFKGFNDGVVSFQSVDNEEMTINLDSNKLSDTDYVFETTNLITREVKRFNVFEKQVSYVINPNIKPGMILLVTDKSTDRRTYVCVVDELVDNMISMRALNLTISGGKPESLTLNHTIMGKWSFEEV